MKMNRFTVCKKNNTKIQPLPNTKVLEINPTRNKYSINNSAWMELTKTQNLGSLRGKGRGDVQVERERLEEGVCRIIRRKGNSSKPKIHLSEKS